MNTEYDPKLSADLPDETPTPIKIRLSPAVDGVLYDRRYTVIPFTSPEAANTFCATNSDYGVIAERAGTVYLAKLDHMGEKITA